MFIIDDFEMESIALRMDELQPIDPHMLEGFACSASDTSCGCGWDCSSQKT